MTEKSSLVLGEANVSVEQHSVQEKKNIFLRKEEKNKTSSLKLAEGQTMANS